MKRRVLNFLTLLSLLPCGAATGLWARSGGGGDQFIFTTGDRFWWVLSGRSGVYVKTAAGWPRQERPRWMPRLMRNTHDRIPFVALSEPPLATEWRRLGIDGRRGMVTTRLDAAGAPVSVATYLAQPPSDGAGRWSAQMRFDEVHVPYWMALAAFGALPLSHAAVALRRALQRRRLAARQCCPDCGYDLRATLGRCPECGTITAASPLS